MDGRGNRASVTCSGGLSPLAASPPDNDERRWLKRKAILIEVPGKGGRPVVSFGSYETWDAFLSRLLDEMSEEHYRRTVAVMLDGWQVDNACGPFTPPGLAIPVATECCPVCWDGTRFRSVRNVRVPNGRRQVD